MNQIRHILPVVLLMLWTSFSGAADVEFGRDIRPILSDRCFKCHGPDKEQLEGDLRLDTKAAALASRDGDPAIVPGSPDKSLLIARIFSDDPDEQMPPADSNLSLTDQEKKLFRDWIAQGAKWEEHWSLIAPQQPKPPEVTDKTWSRNDIDRFILARLQQAKLHPSPEATKERLLRRVTLDLTGLPPTLKEIDAFLADTSPDAYEKVVDRLLASPSYGERMVWDWLDAARYADTNGFQGDPERTMWPWRDWVIRAMNSNMPFDQFTIEQLAGDLLPNATLDQRIATGFNRNHMHNGEGGRIAEETRVENVFDRVETTATVWLGLTLTCSRCHDHKYDPITQREYYQFSAFFNNTSENGKGRSGQMSPAIDVPTPELTARLNALRSKLTKGASPIDAWEAMHLAKKENAKEKPTEQETPAKEVPEVVIPKKVQDALKMSASKRSVTQLQTLIDHFKKAEADYAKLLVDQKKVLTDISNARKQMPRVMVMDEMKKPRETFILVRGTYNKPSDKVTAGVPASLPPLSEGVTPNRLALARWLVAPEHPLTARVTVNRSWQLFFGSGLVKTSEDFGVQGDEPSHPQLLDWLATEFIRTGWDVKQIHKLIVTSAAYRQTSRVTPQLLEQDPANRLISRGPRYRRPSWMLRDQALAVSGLLVNRLGGPSVKPYQPQGVWAEATFGKKRYQQDHGEKLYRRSVYTFWRRIVGPTMFFDVARRQTCSVKNSHTNTPLHALTTLNDVAYVEAARQLAQRVMTTGGDDVKSRLATAFRMATSRHPTTAEQKILVDRWQTVKKQFTNASQQAAELLKVGESPRDEKLDVIEHAAYAAVCSLILNLDETLTKE